MASSAPSHGFKALGHPLRLRVLEYVRERAVVGQRIDGVQYWVGSDETSCQRELASKFNVPLSTLAHHLRLMIAAGVLIVRREKAEVLLGGHEAKLLELKDFLSRNLAPPPIVRAQRPRHVVLNAECPARGSRPSRFSPEALARLLSDAKVRYFGGRGGVDYWGLARSPEFAECRRLVWSLRRFDPASLKTHDQAVAFWLNLYNLLYIHAVLTLGVDRSVQEIETVFGQVGYSIAGRVFTAADIEHGILRCNRTATNRPRPQFKRADPRRRHVLKRLDPRVYFALVCGTRSCPAVGAYAPDVLASQLDAATAAYLTAEVRLLPDERALVLPMMFSWYRLDFDKYPGGLGSFLLRYLPADERRRALEQNPDIELRFTMWDWRLNDVGRVPSH